MKLCIGAIDAEEMVDLAFVPSGWPLMTVMDLYAVLDDWDVTPTDEEAGCRPPEHRCEKTVRLL